jgi:hypothetical protein
VSLETVLSELLLRIIPDPVMWGIFGFIGLAILLRLWRSPASVSGHLAFLLTYTLFLYLGGIFRMVNYLMLAGVAIALYLGFTKLGAR